MPDNNVITLPILYGIQDRYDNLQSKDDTTIYICADSGNMYLGEAPIGKDTLFSSNYEISNDFGEIGQFCITPYGVYYKANISYGNCISNSLADKNLCSAWINQGTNMVTPSDGSTQRGDYYLSENGKYVLFNTTTNGGTWYISPVGSDVNSALRNVNNSYATYISADAPTSGSIPTNGTWSHTLDNTLFRLTFAKGSDKGAWTLFSGYEIDENGNLYVGGELLSGSQIFSDSAAISITTDQNDASHINLNISKTKDNAVTILDDGLYVNNKKQSTTYQNTADTTISWNMSDNIFFLDSSAKNSITINIIPDTAEYGILYLRNSDSSENKSLHFNINGTSIYGDDLPSYMQTCSSYKIELWKVPNTENSWYVRNADKIASDTVAGMVKSVNPDTEDKYENIWGTIHVNSDGTMNVNNLKNLTGIRRFS